MLSVPSVVDFNDMRIVFLQKLADQILRTINESCIMTYIIANYNDVLVVCCDFNMYSEVCNLQNTPVSSFVFLVVA